VQQQANRPTHVRSRNWRRRAATTAAAALAVGGLLSSTLVLPGAASAAEPQRCYVVTSDITSGSGSPNYDWLCDNTSTPTYTQISVGEGSSIFRAADWRNGNTRVTPIARGHWEGNNQVWESNDGFGTRTWSSPQPGYWIDQPGPSWMDQPGAN